MIEEGIYSFLSGDTAVAGITGGRVFAKVRPEKTDLPNLLYWRQDTAPDALSMCGTVDPQLGFFRIQSADRTYRGAKLLAKAVRQTLLDFTGTMGDTYVVLVTRESESDSDESEPGLFCVDQVFKIWFRS